MFSLARLKVKKISRPKSKCIHFAGTKNIFKSYNNNYVWHMVISLVFSYAQLS